jgi:carbon storage regulator
MLVLTRKLGEQIVIPDCSVTITVIEVKRDKVRLGIAAPPQIAVLRDELPPVQEMEDAPVVLVS